MNLAEGDKLGPYEILEAAGAGGMGEVFKARDTRLDRTVAIKILPPEIAGMPNFRQRFEREAKAISSLNHPNICTLHDVGQSEGADFLVMEYLEGETLADRLLKGPVPYAELLQIAAQIAAALDSAHQQGMIHRDLKPGNVMLTRDGAKLLDFGLAKLHQEAGSGHGPSALTQTTPLTGAGTILGTMQYMAPEQLEGKEADARSDIFAFGAILYEMSTGKRAFEGTSNATLIAAIIEREPVPISVVVPETPPIFERLVKKCLSKDPQKRWQSASDLSDELRWMSQAGSQAGLPAHIVAKRRLKFTLARVVGAITIATTLIFAYLWLSHETPTPNQLRFTIRTRTDISQVSWPCVSPDGKYLAFSAIDSEGEDRIWIRPLNSLEAYALPGTENAGRPFWSPDSKYLAFVVGRNQLKKIPAAGGPAQLICETANGSDGTWGTGGYIIYDASTGDSLHLVSASGGAPVPLLGIDREAGEVTHAWPWFLPDGKHYLYLAEMSEEARAAGNYLLRVGNIETREAQTLFPIDARVQYCEPGYLVYFKSGILLAHRFDPDKLEVIGEAMPLTDEVGVGEADRAEFGLSDQGTLAYQTSSSLSTQKIVWVNREGEEVGQIGDAGTYHDIFLSPDESRLAIATVDDDQSDIWIYDLLRDVRTRITFAESQDITPLWSLDNRFIYYSNNETGIYKLYKKAANGLGQAMLLYANDTLHSAVVTRAPDDRWLYGPQVKSDWNIVRFNPEDSTSAEVVVGTPYYERGAAVSPDGIYLAYYSNESDRYEVYVLELEEGGGRWQISSDGGRYPQWSKDGSQLYYFSTTWDFIAVPVSTEGTFAVGKPKVLFNKTLSIDGFGRTRYAVTSDTNKFIMSTPMASTGGGEFNIVVNWPVDLGNR